jgi:hypothetical protein
MLRRPLEVSRRRATRGAAPLRNQDRGRPMRWAIASACLEVRSAVYDMLVLGAKHSTSPERTIASGPREAAVGVLARMVYTWSKDCRRM